MKELLKEHKQIILPAFTLLFALLCLYPLIALSLWICANFCQQYKAVSVIIAFAVGIIASFAILLFGGKLNVDILKDGIKIKATATAAAIGLFSWGIMQYMNCNCNDCTSREICITKLTKAEGKVESKEKIENKITDTTEKMKIAATQRYREGMKLRTKYLIDSLAGNCNNKELILHIEKNIELIEETTE